ncbi:MAG: protein kinase, partial [Myxococcota bacterium]
MGRRWRLERFLDGGGMGSVWQATDLRLEEPAAVKLLNPHLVRTPEAKERFLREARAAARLRGPHVVSVLDFDLDAESGVPYMAMELLLGEDLAARLTRGALGFLQTRSMLSDVSRAVARAHRLGVVHRDLKPGNIFLAKRER